MAKRQCNFRLSEGAILAIKIQAKERHCSEGEVIEAWATGSSGVTGNTVACDAAVAGSSPALPTIPAGFIAPKGSFSKDDLKAMIAGGRREVVLAEVPAAPFDLNLEGEPHRVTNMRPDGRGKLALFYMGAGEAIFRRYLAEGELEALWRKRNV